jgi:hypothetical protein
LCLLLSSISHNIRKNNSTLSKNAQGVKSISEEFENDLQIDVKLFTIIYADDTVLLAESVEELNNFVSPYL